MSNTLGTALGDFVATDTGLGFERGALIFAGLIALVAAVHFWTTVSDSVLFWSAYVPTCPLGDTLTKPHADGGFALSGLTSSFAIALLMVAAIAATHHSGASRARTSPLR